MIFDRPWTQSYPNEIKSYQLEHMMPQKSILDCVRDNAQMYSISPRFR